MELKKNTSNFYIDVPLPSETLAKKILYFTFDMSKLVSFKLHHQMVSKHSIAVKKKKQPRKQTYF